MQTHFGSRRTPWLLGAAMALVTAATAGAQQPPPLLGPEQLPMVEPIRPSDYWIGLNCRPAEDALRAQLGLPEGEGLVVELVVPDSPAAEAGIERFDVVVKADGKPLRKLQDLVDAVDAAKEKSLKLELRRGGKPVELVVKPAKRPESVMPLPTPQQPWQPPYDWMRRYVPGFQPGDEQGPWRFRFWGPGGILPPDAKPEPPLPSNLSVTITRSGDEPVKIVVKRGDQKWEITEDQLDKLPEDIRPHVERMLGRSEARQPAKPGEPDRKTRSHDFDFVPDWRPPHWEGWQEGRLEERLQEMSRVIDELRKSVEELRERRPRLKPAPKVEEAPKLKEAPKFEEQGPEKKPEQV